MYQEATIEDYLAEQRLMARLKNKYRKQREKLLSGCASENASASMKAVLISVYAEEIALLVVENNFSLRSVLEGLMDVLRHYEEEAAGIK